MNLGRFNLAELETWNLKLETFLVPRFTIRALAFTIYGHAPVAQLDRVPDYESGGRMFESCRVHHFLPTIPIP
jgi:hypothetical protein